MQRSGRRRIGGASDERIAPRGDGAEETARDVVFGRDPGYIGYGRLQPGQRSWADLGVRSVGRGAADANRPSYQGRGPRGYVRSDERLQELICERLTDDPLVDASDVDVQVDDGEVTLSGGVRDKKMKWRAEDLA
jgi:osmotically-inducible protein OsmY